ncbi:fasciclin domain-containing protein [bacterium]|nr:fasciclin domain-containing protein [bacterium]
MKTTLKNLTLTVATLALTVAPLSAHAHCGACGSGEAHAEHAKADAHAHQAELPAIYPLAKGAGFKTLTAAVEAAGLDETLTKGGPFTVFAPTDEAFAKLPEGTVAHLLANPEQLKKVLLLHVVSGKVAAADVVKLHEAESLNGEKLTIDTKDGVKIDGAKVVQTDIEASNGIVHVIDTVLIPENL